MGQKEERIGVLNRYRVYAYLCLTLTLSALAIALLFGSLNVSLAAPLPAAGPIESDLGYFVQSDVVTTLENQTTLTATLLVATSPDFPPMEYYSGTQIVGHDIDLMNAIAVEMGATVVYTDVAFNDIVDGLVAGQYDAIISTLSISPDREEVIDFTLPYVSFGGTDNVAVGVQQGDNALRSEINNALRQLRADGTLQAIIAAIADDKPEWQPGLPEWPVIYLPILVRSSGD